MGAALTARNLEKRFGGIAAVDGVDLDVRPGEFVSLLGPSGCGKTTTLRMIAGLESADRGEIRIDGRDVTDLSPQKRELGMVFQQYALFPNLTAFDNVAFALRVRRRSKLEIEQRVNDLLQMVHLDHAAAKYPHELSGGMQQRVALARALAIAPPLLLLDEPLSALDAAIRDTLRTELRRLQRQLGVTVIYVTHDQAEAMALSDAIVVMELGRVSQVGAPRELYDRPATSFTAGFIGASNRRTTTVGHDGAIAWGTRTLRAEAARHFAPGEQVNAGWRPEDASITRNGVSAAGALSGNVELITFLGPMTRLDVLLDGESEPVMVDLPSQQAREVATGDRVHISIPPEAIRLYVS